MTRFIEMSSASARADAGAAELAGCVQTWPRLLPNGTAVATKGGKVSKEGAAELPHG